MYPVAWNRHVLCYAMHGIDLFCAMPCVEQPCAWTFYVIHTCEHVCTVIMHSGYCYFMRVYLVLIAQRICCISIDFYEVLAVVSHVKTSILIIM